jgi:hypothetical protein
MVNHPNRSKAPQFHEGQDVEVTKRDPTIPNWNWRKAKIVARASDAPVTRNRQWAVQFTDNSRAVFDAEHMRSIPEVVK